MRTDLADLPQMDPLQLLTDASNRLSTAVAQTWDLPTVVDAKIKVDALILRVRDATSLDSSVAVEIRAIANSLVPIAGQVIQEAMLSLLAAANMCIR